MSYVMTNTTFAERAKDIAANYKTLYVMGCFGAPLTASAKKRYIGNGYSYNKRNADKINAATASTFGFDCVCLIKGILWGWDGNKNKVYGGATYASNGVPDIDADAMMDQCREKSADFSHIEVGEAVGMKGHIGVYIGDGLAVECTPSWQGDVQITACNCSKSGYNRRNWTRHGKLPWVEYVVEQKPQPGTPTTKAAFSVLAWQKAAMADGYKFPKYGADGIWGSECEAVAKKAVCKYHIFSYKLPNLTKLVQKAVGTTIDGKFGKNTKAAVVAWQKKNGLTADGEVGINTWKKMLGIS